MRNANLSSSLKKDMVYKSYFTEFNAVKGFLYGVVLLFYVSLSFVAVVEPWLSPSECYQPVETSIEFQNSLYVYNPCLHARARYLMWLTPKECEFCRRLIASVLCGAVIGWERREADRPAGIRTMALVSLGSALFTIDSAYAFLQGPMAWDASRIAAAIPSGVGFLGSALIFKSDERDAETHEASHVVHGLTTAAALWVSAAVGVSCGGAQYVPAVFCVSLMVVLLRFGPRSKELPVGATMDDEESELHEEENQHELILDREVTPLLARRTSEAGTLPSIVGDVPSEVSSTVRRRRRKQQSVRSSRPQLGASM